MINHQKDDLRTLDHKAVEKGIQNHIYDRSFRTYRHAGLIDRGCKKISQTIVQIDQQDALLQRVQVISPYQIQALHMDAYIDTSCLAIY